MPSGSSGYVGAIEVSGSTVYAGGFFTSIGGQTRNAIAALDDVDSGDGTGDADANWDPNVQNVGAPGNFGFVDALALDGDIVYAAGGIGQVGGVNYTGIAAIDDVDSGDGTGDPDPEWKPGEGPPALNNRPLAIAASGSTVYVGGLFTTPRNRLAAFDDPSAGDGTGDLDPNWNPALSGSGALVVSSLAVSGSKVYAGGRFATIGGQSLNNFAALDDADSGDGTGDADPAFNPNPNESVNAIAVSGSSVFAGGFFNSVGGVTRNRLAALNTVTGEVTDWNPNANGAVNALAVSGDTVYAGGSFTSVGGQGRNRIAAIDASTGNPTTWNPNANNTVNALAVSGSTVYAGGLFNGANSIGGQARNRIAALDATSGNATAFNPGATGQVLALAVSGPTVYAGGSFNGANSIGGQTRNRIAALDATTGTADPEWDPNASGTVRALALSGSTVYAGGDFNGANSIGGQARNRIAALDDVASGDGTGDADPAWDPNANNLVFALAVSGSNVYAGGVFTSIGGENRNQLAELDASTGTASSWDPNVGFDVPSVSALATSGSTVLAGGAFESIGLRSQTGFAAFGDPAPANTALPQITGGTLVGQQLTCSDGTWTGSPTFTRQWLRDGLPIPGETGTTYTVQFADIGTDITCEVTATNGTASVAATSAATTIPTEGQPQPPPSQPPGGGTGTDTDPPETTIDQGPPQKVKTKKKTVNVAFEVSSDEAGSSFACNLDGGGFEPCSSEPGRLGGAGGSDAVSFTLKVKKGAHELEVRATDPAGNTDPTPDAHDWSVKRKKRR